MASTVVVVKNYSSENSSSGRFIEGKRGYEIFGSGEEVSIERIEES